MSHLVHADREPGDDPPHVGVGAAIVVVAGAAFPQPGTPFGSALQRRSKGTAPRRAARPGGPVISHEFVSWWVVHSSGERDEPKGHRARRAAVPPTPLPRRVAPPDAKNNTGPIAWITVMMRTDTYVPQRPFTSPLTIRVDGDQRGHGDRANQSIRPRVAPHAGTVSHSACCRPNIGG